MNPNQTNETEPVFEDSDKARFVERRTEGRFGRGPALKAMGAALIGGLLGGTQPRPSEAKRRTKKRPKTCNQKCPKKPTPTPTPPAGPKVMWATVDRGGQLARGSGAVSAKRTSDGSYRVYFEQEVEKCAHVAQITYFAAFGEAYTHPSAVEPNSVTVFTYDISQSRIAANKDFHLVVTC